MKSPALHTGPCKEDIKSYCDGVKKTSEDLLHGSEGTNYIVNEKSLHIDVVNGPLFSFRHFHHTQIFANQQFPILDLKHT